MGCSTLNKVPKPDPEGCGNFVAGYGLCNTVNTHKVRFLTPNEWQKMKAGPGFWFTPTGIAEFHKFALKICDVTKSCTKDNIATINDTYNNFVNEIYNQQQKLKEQQ